MRTNLIMHFHCSECGQQLRLEHDHEAKHPPTDKGGPRAEPKEDAGAFCYRTPKISIKPCWNCIRKYRGPAEALAKAVDQLLHVKEED